MSGSRATILLLSCAAFFSGAALRVCDPLLPRIAADFSRTPGQAGQVVISFAVAYGLMQLLFGPLGDRYGKARMVSLATAGCAVAACLSALAPGYDALLALRVLWGMAAAGIIPLSMAWIGDAVPYEQRQATLARLGTGTIGGMMAGQLAGGLFADAAAGWRGAFFTLAAGYCVVAVLLLRRVRAAGAAAPAPGSRASFSAQVLSVLRTPWARVVLATAAAEGALEEVVGVELASQDASADFAAPALAAPSTPRGCGCSPSIAARSSITSSAAMPGILLVDFPMRSSA